MIRHMVTEDDLIRRVDTALPGWRARAATRTAKFVADGKYEERSGIWSEIKPVFMKLQHNKCAYCERQLASADFGGAVEHDLEHFRPKSSVLVWPGATEFGYTTGAASSTGYYWLAYHLLNYSVACKKCNTGLKLNYFPISASRGRLSATPAELTGSEKPYLVFPVGDMDDDPADIITYMGINAVPAKKTGPRKRRADVTIAFFRLNNREELRKERAGLLDLLGLHLEIINDPAVPVARQNEAKRTVERLLKPNASHSACVTAMTRLYQADTEAARGLIQAARDYLDSLL